MKSLKLLFRTFAFFCVHFRVEISESDFLILNTGNVFLYVFGALHTFLKEYGLENQLTLVDVSPTLRGMIKVFDTKKVT